MWKCEPSVCKWARLLKLKVLRLKDGCVYYASSKVKGRKECEMETAGAREEFSGLSEETDRINTRDSCCLNHSIIWMIQRNGKMKQIYNLQHSVSRRQYMGVFRTSLRLAMRQDVIAAQRGLHAKVDTVSHVRRTIGSFCSFCTLCTPPPPSTLAADRQEVAAPLLHVM
jgi:hypothetical protein